MLHENPIYLRTPKERGAYKIDSKGACQFANKSQLWIGSTGEK